VVPFSISGTAIVSSPLSAHPFVFPFVFFLSVSFLLCSWAYLHLNSAHEMKKSGRFCLLGKVLLKEEIKWKMNE